MKKTENVNNATMIGNEGKSGQQEGRFTFVGEVLALDLVNTEVIVRGKWHDLLETGQDVKEWWQAARARYPEVEQVLADPIFEGEDAFDFVLVQALNLLRGALRHIFAALVEGRPPAANDLSIINGVLRTGYHSLELAKDGDLRAQYHASAGARGTVLFPIALSALHLIQNKERARLHKCENERCILYFYDTTKSATRRWCSLGCMDRARSAQRYKLAKGKYTPTK